VRFKLAKQLFFVGNLLALPRTFHDWGDGRSSTARQSCIRYGIGHGG
jgi:hypothetical protein